MLIRVMGGAVLTFWSLFGPSTAAELTIYLSGDAFEGGPAFEISIGTTIIGTGTLSDPVPDEEEFVFEIDNGLLEGPSPLRVQLTNDKYEEGKGDRNLSIVRAVLNGVEFAGTDFMVPEVSGLPPMSGRLLSNDQVAILPPPEGGWIAAPTCDATSEVVFPFRTEVLPKEVPELSTVIEQAHGDCSVTILGYASTGGADDVNKAISLARAQAVATYLSEHGATFRSSQVEGRGVTTEFGNSAENRRVVVTVAP